MSEEEPNQELELYKLIIEGNYECGWVSDSTFFVWVGFSDLQEFMASIIKIFGIWMFEDGGFEIHLLHNSVCIDLTTILDESEVDLTTVFPKNKFKH